MNGFVLLEQLKLSFIHSLFRLPFQTSHLPSRSLTHPLTRPLSIVVIAENKELFTMCSQKTRRESWKSKWTRKEIVQVKKVLCFINDGVLLFSSLTWFFSFSHFSYNGFVWQKYDENVASFLRLSWKKGGACNQGSERKKSQFSLNLDKQLYKERKKGKKDEKIECGTMWQEKKFSSSRSPSEKDDEVKKKLCGVGEKLRNAQLQKAKKNC